MALKIVHFSYFGQLNVQGKSLFCIWLLKPNVMLLKVLNFHHVIILPSLFLSFSFLYT